eukprot:g6847.t1
MKLLTTPKTIIFTFFSVAALLHSTANAGGGHGHGADAPWEYIALYHLVPSKGDYTFYFSKQNDKYADATFKISYETTAKEGAEGIEAVEAHADEVWDKGNATEVEAFNFTTFLTKEKLYELHFNDNLPKSAYMFKVPEDTHYVFFFQHFPEEFDLHLIDAKGNEIKPEATEPATEKKKGEIEYAKFDNGGLAILASCIVAFCTLLGIFTTLPMCGKDKKNCLDGSHFLMVLASAFAAGTLFSTTVMLILPEGVRMVDGAMGFKDEGLNNFVIGITLFSGFFLGAVIHVLCEQFNGKSPIQQSTNEGIEMKNKNSGDAEEGIQNKEVEVDSRPWYAVTPSRWGNIVSTIVIGDFLHNFVDGIAIGVAFQSCDTTMGWVVAGSAILHEIPQEISDFLLLKLHGNMSTFEALLMNFLSGLSCIIGAGIALGTKLSGYDQGIILLIAAGQYFWIATVECFPKVLLAKTTRESYIYLGTVLFGVLLISLVLIVHKHCVPEIISGGDGAAESDHGHNHAH